MVGVQVLTAIMLLTMRMRIRISRSIGRKGDISSGARLHLRLFALILKQVSTRKFNLKRVSRSIAPYC